MLTTVFVLLAAVVAAGWISSRARALVAFVTIAVGIALAVSSDADPLPALSAAVLMAAGSVALGGMYFGPGTRIAFGLVTAAPFAFVAFAAWPLAGAAPTSESGTDLVLLACAGVVALIALSVGRPRTAAAAQDSV